MSGRSHEEQVADLTGRIKERVGDVLLDDKDLVNMLIQLVNLQAAGMEEVMSALNLNNGTVEGAKQTIQELRDAANGIKEGDGGVRHKFYERVEYVASEIRDIDTERNKLIMWNARNGDLYMSICPESHRGGISMRFERSGGCNTRNPELLEALMDAYDAIAGNFK